MENSSYEEIKNKIEAILFSYADWITVQDIVKILNLDSEELVRSILQDLKDKFKEGFSFSIINEEDKWKMKVRDEYDNLLEEFISNTEIPKSALNVLAVIAYEQPITKTRLNEIMGRSVVKEINYLFKNGFIVYTKKGVGRYYKVTKKFKDYFQIDVKEFKKKFKSEDLKNYTNNNEDNIENKNDENITKEKPEKTKIEE